MNEKEFYYLTVRDFEILCEVIDTGLKLTNDPPPDYKDSYFDKLDSVISTPRRTFNKKDLYPSLYDKAACYMYFINKFHPFNNGNKRISVLAPYVFLRHNGYKITLSPLKMYKLAKEITLSDNKNKDKDFKRISKLFKDNSVKII